MVFYRSRIELEGMKELAKRAVACKGWQWMPGMLSSDTGLRLDEFTLEKDWEAKYPDLSDPATLGCLLALVRAAWKDEGCAAVVASYTFELGYRWRVVGGHHHGSGFMAMSQKHYQTEAETLVAALEAAP